MVTLKNTLSPLQALAAQAAGARLIDVREANETALGHARDAELIARSKWLAGLPSLPRSGTTLLICQSGARSFALAQQMQAQGLSTFSVEGGSTRWLAEGLPWQADARLSEAEFARYSRQLLLPELGVAGQEKLKNARVLLIGAGGLGSPAALYLAAAGVGTLGISDGDHLDVSNLARQVLHRTDHIGALKTDSAIQTLTALNPLVMVRALPAVTASTVDALLPQFDVIVDGSDNFATRFLVSDACVRHKKPLVYGAVLRFDGQVSVFLGSSDASGASPCYRCLFPAPPTPEHAPNCAQAGVLGVLPGVIGTLQATETLKLITGIGATLAGRLLMFDAKAAKFREIRVPRDPFCPGCA
jgi:sulfur-carrier protein adenylyltransferase/sulfurtransferase